MKKRLKIQGSLLILGTMLMISGCTSEAPVDKPLEETSSTRSQEGLEQLDLKNFEAKINNKESFIVMMSQSTCTYCNTLKRSLIPYLRDHPDIPFFEIEFDMLGSKKSDIDANFRQVQTLIEEFDGSTPTMFYIEEGSVKESAAGAISEIALHNFMIDCGYVDEAKQEEITTSNALTMENLSEASYEEVSDKILKKATFYLYMGEEDRYNAEFSKQLSAYAKENKIDVQVLNLTKLGQSQPESQEAATALQTAFQTISQAVPNVQYTPSLFYIKDGVLQGTGLVDNVGEEALQAWFKQ